MDVVYILGTGTKSKDANLKYSIRSVLENVMDIEKVYIVGEKPAFLKDIKHIEADDIYNQPWQNEYHKTKKACFDTELSESFMMMNEDIFITEKCLASEMPFYSLKNSNGGNSGMYNFDVNMPMIINKLWYKSMPLEINQKGTFSPRSFYGNFYRANPRAIQDLVLKRSNNFIEYDSQIVGRMCFATDKEIFKHPMFKKWIDGLYPQKSRLEI